MKRFEYLRIVFTIWRDDYFVSDERLNKLGSEGWELVSFYPIGNGSIGVFKRELILN